MDSGFWSLVTGCWSQNGRKLELQNSGAIVQAMDSFTFSRPPSAACHFVTKKLK
jgi:hypothetical protein